MKMTPLEDNLKHFKVEYLSILSILLSDKIYSSMPASLFQTLA
jgi:hypothetical protein